MGRLYLWPGTLPNSIIFCSVKILFLAERLSHEFWKPSICLTSSGQRLFPILWGKWTETLKGLFYHAVLSWLLYIITINYIFRAPGRPRKGEEVYETSKVKKEYYVSKRKQCLATALICFKCNSVFESGNIVFKYFNVLI